MNRDDRIAEEALWALATGDYETALERIRAIELETRRKPAKQPRQPKPLPKAA